MRSASTRRYYRPAFEFQRGGPFIRGSAAHKPDLSISVARPSQLQQQLSQFSSQQQQQIILPFIKTRTINNNNSNNNNSLSSSSARSPRRPNLARNIPVTLDMFVIAEDCGSLSYRHIMSLNLSSRKLNSVDSSALQDLVSLVRLDVSDNRLRLEPFGALPQLQELDFSCNNLASFSYGGEAATMETMETSATSSSLTTDGNKEAALFPQLKKLNMNFNNIGKSLDQFSRFPNLEILYLRNNNLNSLPENMSQFLKIEFLDLSFNMLNKESNFVTLAALPNLKTLVLDNNEIITIPKLQFGFNKLTKISLRNNKIEAAADIISLADLENLSEVDISNNPMNIYRKEIKNVKDVYDSSNILLVYSMNVEMMNFQKQKQRAEERSPRNFPNIVRVDYDQLLLPNKELRKMLHKNTTKDKDLNNEEEGLNKNEEEEEFKEAKKSTKEKVESDVFMTDFSEIPPIQNLPLPQPTPLPSKRPEDEDEDQQQIFSIWKDVPVIQEENRKLFSSGKSVEKFTDAFKKLRYIVEHPNVLLKQQQEQLKQQRTLRDEMKNSASASSSTSNISPPLTSRSQRSARRRNDGAQETFPVNSPLPPRSKSTRVKKPRKEINIEEKLNSAENFSKDEVMKMLQSMESRLNTAEVTIDEVDDDGLSPVDYALDQTNFSTLHKQYETIRAEIVNTLKT